MKKIRVPVPLILLFLFAFFNCRDVSFIRTANALDEDLVSLDYKDAELSSVLRSLAYSYDLNLVIAKDIKGEVTLSLKDVTINEALDAILSVNGYAFTKKGKLIYITTGPGIEGIDMVTVPLQLNYLTAAEAARLIGKVISSKGDIQENEATNSLVVTDFPGNIAKIKNVLRKIDVPPVQVLIEAKILDITSGDLQNLGVTYTGDFTDRGIFDHSYDHEDRIAGNVTLAGPSSTLTGGQVKITTFSVNNLEMTATIDALIQDNKAHLLASPSIATLNGKEARIIIGEKYPYTEQTQTTTGTTETTKFIDIGTTLRVTPQVSPDGWITMIVHPEVSSVSEALDAGPRITTREADATVRVRNGETIVIGGLIKKQDDHTRNRIPILGDLPILGLLFSDRRSDLTQTELAVFITPRIIRSQEQRRKIRAIEDEEVYVNIDGIGERVLVSHLYKAARNLELKRGIESRRKDKERRMAEALDLYKQIASQFPGNERADDALYRMGKLYYNYFKDPLYAKKVFSQLSARYPESSYAPKARNYLKRIEKQLDKKKKPQKKKKKKHFNLTSNEEKR